ncbi:hypothetical protein [Streptomyces sp. XD-27]|uniref:hypothetical protein n=1 Tax=Streptomyces sp. XD-27 TaxID=3062779 RepID=UPI0026F4350E|nr:hypothetical protein [Streptomyces sp. XD-27]WKX70979.1 hypothetical protein Q3Y56_14625 [Streptomyces sp. XD-27]
MSDVNHPVYEEYFTRSPFQLLGGAGWKRLVAFRVDETGVTLGGAPARYKSQTAFVPWQDIEAVVLWQHETAGLSPMSYVGVRRRPGAPPLPGPNRNLGPQQTARLAPHVEHELFLASRAINLWRIDPGRLVLSVQAFAPGMPVLLYEEKTE